MGSGKHKMKKNFYSSWEKKLRRLLLSLTLLFGFLAFGQTVPPYENGDYRSLQTGAWNSTATWQVYNGTTWVAATSYPGQNTSVGNQGDYKAIIQAGHHITVSADATYYFGDVYLLANNPVTNTYPTISSGANVGRLILSGNGTQLNLLGTDQNVYIYGGVLIFNENNTELGLLNGNSVIISNYNGPGAPAFGSNAIQPVSSSAGGCTGNQQIVFYNPTNGQVSQQYAVCSGNNSTYTFAELNNSGGSIAAQLSVSPPAVCVGESAVLTAGYTGSVPDTRIISYTLKLDSGPSGYTFATLTGTFPDPGNAASIPDPTVGPFTEPGTYVFSLTVSYDYDGTAGGYQVTSTETVTVTVKPQTECACYNDPTLGTGVPSKFGITSLGRAGSDTAGANWPMVRTGAHMVLEANTKGFVITRITDTGAISNPIKGMIVYDISNDCLSVYDGTTWACFEKPSCP